MDMHSFRVSIWIDVVAILRGVLPKEKKKPIKGNDISITQLFSNLNKFAISFDIKKSKNLSLQKKCDENREKNCILSSPWIGK